MRYSYFGTYATLPGHEGYIGTTHRESMLVRVGMHQGVMAASTGWDALHPALQQHCGAITRQQPINPAEWLALPKGEDAFHVTTSGGRAYLLDPSMVLTSSLDLPVTLSSELACTVVSLGAETVSGTYWFAAADSGRLRRLHWNLRATLTQPFELGEALIAESRVPLEDVDGKGLLACLAELGFDPLVVTEPIEGGERYLWTGTTLPAEGSIGQQIKAHHERFARTDKEDWTKRVKVVRRADGGLDMQYQPPAVRKSLLDRLFHR